VTRPVRLAGVLLLALASVVLAGEEPPPAGLVDVGGHLDGLRADLDARTSAPFDAGHDGALRTAWRDLLRRRIGNMRRRVKDLADEKDWVVEAASRTVRGLEPGKWTSFVRTLATLHTELGTCADGYRGTRVDGRRSERAWLRRYPGPEPIGIVPSAAALAEVDRAIRALQIQGLDVPYSLWQARERLRLAVLEEERLAREEKRREYDERKAAAFDAIRRDVDDTRNRLAGEAETFARGQRSLRALMATAQRIEEDRLQAMLDVLPDDAERDARADELLKSMRAGREKALDFDGKPLSRYGSLVEKGWMVPRAALLRLIEAATPDSR